MIRQRPRSVMAAIWLIGGIVALTGLSAVLTRVFEDQFIEAWADGRTDLGSVEPPSFAPVAIVMFIVFALLAGVFVMFFRDGNGWARVLLTVLVVVMGIEMLAGLWAGPPALFLVLAVVALLLELATLVCLWHRDTSEFLRGARLASHLPAP